MKILLVNPPYQTITSNYGVGHQVPLGLLMVGGPLIDAGHEVRLQDAECRRLGLREIGDEVRRWRPDVVMTGHAGSTPAHPTCIRMLGAIKASSPAVVTVYGGVYPTYHAGRILADERAVDVIVRGEGEATTLELVGALESGGHTSKGHLRQVAGLAFRDGEEVVVTGDRPPIVSVHPFFSRAAGIQVALALQFRSVRLGIASQDAGDRLDPTMSELRGLNGRIPSAIVLF